MPGDTGGLLRRAVSMVVQLETYGLEARLRVTTLTSLRVKSQNQAGRPF